MNEQVSTLLFIRRRVNTSCTNWSYNPSRGDHQSLIESLVSVVSGGRLLCDVVLDGHKPIGPSIGHSHMKEKRRRTEVPVPLGGVVGDYVPFYLAPRSPMLHANHMAAPADMVTGTTRAVLPGLALRPATSRRPLPRRLRRSEP